MSNAKNEGDSNPPNVSANTTVLTGDTPQETLYNLGCVLQVLSDAAIAEGESPELNRGWWLLLQALSEAALNS